MDSAAQIVFWIGCAPMAVAVLVLAAGVVHLYTAPQPGSPGFDAWFTTNTRLLDWAFVGFFPGAALMLVGSAMAAIAA